MNTYFEPMHTSPDEKAIMEERQHLQRIADDLKRQNDELNVELQIARSDADMLKDVIVRMAMKLTGVTK